METISALLAICAGNSPVLGEFPSQRPVTRSFGVFYYLRWINGWVNNREAGDLRRYRVHYVVTVMIASPAIIRNWEAQDIIVAAMTGSSLLHKIYHMNYNSRQ